MRRRRIALLLAAAFTATVLGVIGTGTDSEAHNCMALHQQATTTGVNLPCPHQEPGNPHTCTQQPVGTDTLWVCTDVVP